MSDDPPWGCQRSIDVGVPAAFAWAYMTDIGNWDDPPAAFEIDGPFIEGARGTTRTPGQPPIAWTVRDIVPGRGYTIESGSMMERAVLLVHWRFDPLSPAATRLTQRIELCGPNAAAYVGAVQSMFEPNLEPGLRRIAARMEASTGGTPDGRRC